MKIVRLEPQSARESFSCGDDDLDEFYSTDSIESAKQLLSVCYNVHDKSGALAAYFSVSNDAISRDSMPKSSHRRVVKLIPREKRYSTLPAVKIGRLGVAMHAQGNSLGTEILSFLKFWFTHNNKTGCRFIVVDANNNPRTLNFYKQNGFDFLIGNEQSVTTRIMYFDLMPLLNYRIAQAD